MFYFRKMIAIRITKKIRKRPIIISVKNIHNKMEKPARSGAQTGEEKS